MEGARMSVSDLYVLLICVLYHHDKNVFEGYVLFDHTGYKGRSYKLKLRRDFQQFYLTLRVLRQN